MIYRSYVGYSFGIWGVGLREGIQGGFRLGCRASGRDLRRFQVGLHSEVWSFLSCRFKFNFRICRFRVKLSFRFTVKLGFGVLSATERQDLEEKLYLGMSPANFASSARHLCNPQENKSARM